MLPKEDVEARTKESRTEEEQHDLASWGANHHVPMTPATVTCRRFYCCETMVARSATEQEYNPTQYYFVPTHLENLKCPI
jgi:hypothetical protein